MKSSCGSMAAGVAAFISVLPAVAAADGAAPAAPPRPDRPPAAVVAITAECAGADGVTRVSGLAAAAMRAAGAFRAIPERPAASPDPEAIAKARALVEAAKKNYFDTHYKEAASQLVQAHAFLSGAPLSAAEDARRWSLSDVARGFLSLAHRAAGDEQKYRAALHEIAATRPSATFDVSFPPDFRKDFEIAVDAAISGAVAPVSVSAPVGTWRVRVDGVERGATPLTVKLSIGPHAIGINRPDGTISYRTVHVAEKGTSLSIEPLGDSSRTVDGTAVVCLPAGTGIEKDDSWKVLGTSRPGAEVLAVYQSAGGFIVARASPDPPAVKGTMFVPAGDAADAAKVAAAINSLYAAPRPPAAAEPPVAEVAASDDGLTGKWWFWTTVGVVTVAAVGVPLYFWLGGGDNSLGGSGVKP